MLSLKDITPLHLADITFPQGHPLAGQRGIVNAFAIKHERGVVLIDTGIGLGNEEVDQLYRPLWRRLTFVLREQRLNVKDVIAVVNTHLHFDHCGQNCLFPAIPIFVQKVEYDAAHTPDFTVIEWVDFPGAAYEQINGDMECLPGITIVSTSGHTPGHQSVLVESIEGSVIIAGQAVYSAADYAHLRETRELPVSTGASTQVLASARRLLAMRPRRVLFSHDDLAWDEVDWKGD